MLLHLCAEMLNSGTGGDMLVKQPLVNKGFLLSIILNGFSDFFSSSFLSSQDQRSKGNQSKLRSVK